MRVGFYAGSFDPFTNGHLEIVKKACKVFDQVIIGIGTHPSKTRRFDKVAMRDAIYEVLERENLDEKVEVYIYNNSMTVDAAKYYGADFLIRGIRNGIDYQYEEAIASINQEIEGIDTVYFRAGNLGNVSSSMVMELFNNDRDISKYVPREILEYMKKNTKIN